MPSLFIFLLLAAFIVWLLEETSKVTHRLSIGLIIVALFVQFWGR